MTQVASFLICTTSASFASNRVVTSIVAVLLSALIGMQTVHAESMQINAQQLQQLIAAGVPVVDVRTPEEWRATGVIPDSHLITFFDQRGNYDLNGWRSRYQPRIGLSNNLLH